MKGYWAVIVLLCLVFVGSAIMGISLATQSSFVSAMELVGSWLKNVSIFVGMVALIVALVLWGKYLIDPRWNNKVWLALHVVTLLFLVIAVTNKPGPPPIPAAINSWIGDGKPLAFLDHDLGLLETNAEKTERIAQEKIALVSEDLKAKPGTWSHWTRYLVSLTLVLVYGLFAFWDEIAEAWKVVTATHTTHKKKIADGTAAEVPWLKEVSKFMVIDLSIETLIAVAEHAFKILTRTHSREA